MLNRSSFLGVSNCYVFKSQLQEYAQKAGISTPVYETVKEGPSHEPCFRSTVIVNNVRYDSVPGFFNRKAAEQSAAEIALMELLKSGNMAECIPQPVQETGLCKNLLQEYAQKMNYAIPSYVCNKQSTLGNNLPFICTVEIGGIHYIGGAAKTKKEAEIKAARTALLAIQSKTGGTESNPDGGSSTLTVLPSKKKGRESNTRSEIAKTVKPKKAEFKKKWAKKRSLRNKENCLKDNLSELGNGNREEGSQILIGCSETSAANKDFQDGQHESSKLDSSSQGIASMEHLSGAQDGDSRTPDLGRSEFIHNERGTSNTESATNFQTQNTDISTNTCSANANAMVPNFNWDGQGFCSRGNAQVVQLENSTAWVGVCQDAQSAFAVTNSSLGAAAVETMHAGVE